MKKYVWHKHDGGKQPFAGVEFVVILKNDGRCWAAFSDCLIWKKTQRLREDDTIIQFMIIDPPKKL